MKHLITPHASYSYVADRLAIGGIMAYGENLSAFSQRINVAYEIDPGAYLFPSKPHANYKLDDTKSRRDVLGQAAEVFRAVEHVKQVHARGGSVLVTCAMGRNRSALVVAEYLIQCGNKPEDIVAKIRERRAHSLTNSVFVQWLCRPRAR